MYFWHSVVESEDLAHNLAVAVGAVVFAAVPPEIKPILIEMVSGAFASNVARARTMA